MAHLGQNPPVSRVNPLDPKYPRVHVAVGWHKYLENDAKIAMGVSAHVEEGNPLEWSETLSQDMEKCGIRVHSKQGILN